MAADSTNKGGRRPLLRIGKYEVLQHIATGGMGAVYKAIDVDLNRTVALKVLSPEQANRDNMLERFRREARSAAKLRHDNIVAIYEFGEFQGTYFLALEFVEGVDLYQYIKAQGRLEPEEARQLLLQAVKALHQMHKNNLVHRDIKPSNFLIARRPDGRLLVKLTDLGLARQQNEEEFRVTRDGATVGTVDYISPEQARNSASADIRSDIYSLGCTFFHMLAGSCPFPEGSLTERIFQHIESRPPDIRQINAEVSPGLALILQRMLAKKPEDRYQTPQELYRDLEHPDQVAATQAAQERRAKSPPAEAATEAMAGPTGAGKKKPPPADTRTNKPVASKSGQRDKPRGQRGRRGQWWHWAAAGTILLMGGFLIWTWLGKTPPEIVNPQPPVPPSLVKIDPQPEPVPPLKKTPPKPPAKAVGRMGPEAPVHPPLYEILQPIDRQRWRAEFFGPFQTFPAPPDRAEVLQVSRNSPGGSGRFTSLAEALASIQPDRPTIVEIHDNGPLYEEVLSLPAGSQVWLRPGEGFRPLLAWDVGLFKASGSEAKGKTPDHFCSLQGGQLVLEDVDVVVKWTDPRPEKPAILFNLHQARFLARRCTFSVAGKHPQGIFLARVEGEFPGKTGPKSTEPTSACQFRLSHCYARGGDLVGLRVQGPAEVLLDGSLVVGGERPLVQGLTDDKDLVTFRVVRTTLVAASTLWRWQSVAGKEGYPQVHWLCWDALLARQEQQTEGEMVAVADAADCTHLSWRAVNCLYLGWKKLLEAPGRTIPAGALTLWRRQWLYVEGDREHADTWPRFPAVEPENRTSADYEPTQPEVCFAATSGTGTLGCDLGAIPAAPASWLRRTFDRFELPPLNLLAQDDPPLIPDPGDGLYHGQRIDLNKTPDLGLFLQSRVDAGKLGPRLVFHLAGSGPVSTSPIRCKGIKELVLFFEPARGKAEPLTLVPNPKTSFNRPALIEVEDGQLQLLNARFRFDNKRLAVMPNRVLVVRRGGLSLYRCRMQGPLTQGPDVYSGLILLESPEGPPGELAVNESTLISGKTLVEVHGPARLRIRGSLLLAADDALALHPLAPPATQCILEQNTIALRRGLIYLHDLPATPLGCEPIVVQAFHNYLLDPFTETPRLASLLRHDGQVVARGLLLWQGQGNALVQQRLQAYAIPADSPQVPRQSFAQWRRWWGPAGEQQLLAVPPHKLTMKVDQPQFDMLVLPRGISPALGAPSPGADLARLGLLKKAGK